MTNSDAIYNHRKQIIEKIRKEIRSISTEKTVLLRSRVTNWRSEYDVLRGKQDGLFEAWDMITSTR